MVTAPTIPAGGESPAFILLPCPGRAPHRVPLALEHAWDSDGTLVHVSRAHARERYTCPCPSCGAALRFKVGKNRRSHFAHFDASRCINPGTLHRRAIEWVIDEGAIFSGASDLVGGLPPPEIIDGTVLAEYTLVMRGHAGRLRQRRADVVILQPSRVVAIEFVRTHDLDAQKLRDYRTLAQVLAQEQRLLQLLVVYLWPDTASFHRWDERAWRNYVLFDAPRRWSAPPLVEAPLLPRGINRGAAVPQSLANSCGS